MAEEKKGFFSRFVSRITGVFSRKKVSEPQPEAPAVQTTDAAEGPSYAGASMGPLVDEQEKRKMLSQKLEKTRKELDELYQRTIDLPNGSGEPGESAPATSSPEESKISMTITKPVPKTKEPMMDEARLKTLIEGNYPEEKKVPEEKPLEPPNLESFEPEAAAPKPLPEKPVPAKASKLLLEKLEEAEPLAGKSDFFPEEETITAEESKPKIKAPIARAKAVPVPAKAKKIFVPKQKPAKGKKMPKKKTKGKKKAVGYRPKGDSTPSFLETNIKPEEIERELRELEEAEKGPSIPPELMFGKETSKPFSEILAEIEEAEKGPRRKAKGRQPKPRQPKQAKPKIKIVRPVIQPKESAPKEKPKIAAVEKKIVAAIQQETGKENGEQDRVAKLRESIQITKEAPKQALEEPELETVQAPNPFTAEFEPTKQSKKPEEPKSVEKDVQDLKKLLEEKTGGQIHPDEINRFQGNVQELLEKKIISKEEVEQNIRNINANEVLEGFTKLIAMIQTPQREVPIEQLPEKFELLPSSENKKPKKPLGTTKEVEKKELVTDFDKILEVVKERGKIRSDELAKMMNIDKKALQEAVDILEESGLIIQEYATFGPTSIVDPEFYRKKKQKKVK